MPAVGIGIILPVREIAMLGASDAAPLIKMAQQVEELGYDHVWVSDSYVARHRLEPLALLAAIALVTDRITIGTAALTAVLREPLTLAHTMATLDHLAPGRVKFAIGTGAPLPVQEEYDRITMPFRERRERVDEAVRLWKKAWRGEDGDLAGQYTDLNGMRLQIQPTQPGGPTLWLASNGKPLAAQRVADFYDGWMPIIGDPDDYRNRLQHIRELAAANGRNPEEIETALCATVNINRDADAAMADLNDFTTTYNKLPISELEPFQLYFGGPEADLADWLSEYARAGARNFVLRIGSFTNYDEQVRALAENVIPVLHGLDLD